MLMELYGTSNFDFGRLSLLRQCINGDMSPSSPDAGFPCIYNTQYCRNPTGQCVCRGSVDTNQKLLVVSSKSRLKHIEILGSWHGHGHGNVVGQETTRTSFPSERLILKHTTLLT